MTSFQIWITFQERIVRGLRRDGPKLWWRRSFHPFHLRCVLWEENPKNWLESYERWTINESSSRPKLQRKQAAQRQGTWELEAASRARQLEGLGCNTASKKNRKLSFLACLMLDQRDSAPPGEEGQEISCKTLLFPGTSRFTSSPWTSSVLDGADGLSSLSDWLFSLSVCIDFHMRQTLQRCSFTQH